jgi:hypothetical protein
MTFARWQPAYAEHGVALVPCEIVDGNRKKPLVLHPERFGLRGSTEIARKFPDATAFGFYAGERSRITVLDVDTTDERALRDALDRHGATPLVVRTASRKSHCYYKHNGEARSIRPWKGQGLPIDLLGAGLSIVPPSIAANGTYEIIHGSLDDLDRLPIMRGLDAALYRRKPSPSPTPSGPKPWSEMRDGDARNDAFYRQLMREAHCCDDYEQLLDRAMTLNGGFAEPMTDQRVVDTARSVWKYTSKGQNRFGRQSQDRRLADVDALVGEPYTLALLDWLQVHNGLDSEFWVADGLADLLKWPRRKLTDARERLIEAGRIVRVSGRPRPGHPALLQSRLRCLAPPPVSEVQRENPSLEV